MIILDLNVLEAVTLSVGIVNLLLAVAIISYGVGWARGSRRQ